MNVENLDLTRIFALRYPGIRGASRERLVSACALLFTWRHPFTSFYFKKTPHEALKPTPQGLNTVY